MGIFNYQGLDEAKSKVLFTDAMAISTYAYHNIDNGFDEGYHTTGFGLGLPLTLVTALIGSTQSQGGLPGIPWNPDSESINTAGGLETYTSLRSYTTNKTACTASGPLSDRNCQILI